MKEEIVTPSCWTWPVQPETRTVPERRRRDTCGINYGECLAICLIGVKESAHRMKQSSKQTEPLNPYVPFMTLKYPLVVIIRLTFTTNLRVFLENDCFETLAWSLLATVKPAGPAPTMHMGSAAAATPTHAAVRTRRTGNIIVGSREWCQDAWCFVEDAVYLTLTISGCTDILNIAHLSADALRSTAANKVTSCHLTLTTLTKECLALVLFGPPWVDPMIRIY